MKKARVLIACLLLAPLAGLSWADTLTLRNGTRYDGTFLGATTRTITFRDRDGVRHQFNISDVQTVDFYSADNSRYDRGRDGFGRYGNSSDQSGYTTVLPAGTELQVRTIDSIDSKTAAERQTYAASIERDVVDNSGAVVIPKGSDARLIIRKVSGSEVVLDLDSVTANGRRYVVSTADLTEKSRSGIGKNKRTAEMVGGGAVLGTLLGAIAGGGKGAVIGAVSGAAVGGVAQVLTRGKEVRVPAETVLTFRLDQELRLRAER